MDETLMVSVLKSTEVEAIEAMMVLMLERVMKEAMMRILGLDFDLSGSKMFQEIKMLGSLEKRMELRRRMKRQTTWKFLNIITKPQLQGSFDLLWCHIVQEENIEKLW